MEAFPEIAILLLTCAAVGGILLGLRQPVLISYIVVGIAVGPAGAELVSAHDAIGLLAELGVAILLFAVGLKLDIDHVRHIGPVALATGLGQLAFTIVIGFAIALGLGRPAIEALYVAVALTFSSTIIIVKLLSDKRELDSLHGRIAVGFLIVQDLAVVVAMMAMSALQDQGQGGIGAVALSIVWRLAAAAAVLAVLMRWVLPTVTASMARSQELLLVFAVGWGAALAALGEWAGFSREAGAFLAGFSLASTPFREAVHARITGLRDFLLLFFFIDLGAKLDLSTLGAEITTSLVLSAFVLIGNPLIVMAIMGYMGYRKRTGFLAGLTVAQISEFSIVFVAMGITLGHVGIETLGLVTIVGLITIAVSTYMIVYSHRLYDRLSPLLGAFERRLAFRELENESAASDTRRAEVIVFGVGRYGGRVLEGLHGAGIRALGVDFDPEVARAPRTGGVHVRFGDGEDPDFLESLPLREAKLIVTTLPQWEANRALLHALRVVGYSGPLAGAARDAAHGRQLAAAGVSHILDPFDDAADHAVEHLASLLGNKA